MPPLWSLAYIKYVAAAIIRAILSNVQHQFFESVFEFSKGKIHFFQKCSKIGLVAKKLIIAFKAIFPSVATVSCYRIY